MIAVDSMESAQVIAHSMAVEHAARLRQPLQSDTPPSKETMTVDEDDMTSTTTTTTTADITRLTITTFTTQTRATIGTWATEHHRHQPHWHSPDNGNDHDMTTVTTTTAAHMEL